MTVKVRRVVTGHDGKGRAVVKIDEVSKNIVSNRPGASACVVWTTDTIPADNSGDFDGAARKVADRLAGENVHVSFDIDVLDPAFAPGTEIPSSGGLSTRQALELLRLATARSRLVGLDIVEVSPPFDNGDITTFAALKVIFETWGRVKAAPKSSVPHAADQIRGKR